PDEDLGAMTHHPCGHHPVRARAIVHHDDAGRIVSIILPDPSPNAPPPAVFAPPNLHANEGELPAQPRGPHPPPPPPNFPHPPASPSATSHAPTNCAASPSPPPAAPSPSTAPNASPDLPRATTAPSPARNPPAPPPRRRRALPATSTRRCHPSRLPPDHNGKTFPRPLAPHPNPYIPKT